MVEEMGVDWKEVFISLFIEKIKDKELKDCWFEIKKKIIVVCVVVVMIIVSVVVMINIVLFLWYCR